MAAVCYRVGKKGIEFLLVRTRGGRWTFPKGGAEPGLTHAQSAALEAWEEAGVHGRIEEVPFTRYQRHTPKGAFPAGARPGSRLPMPGLAVSAHLCAVTQLEAPRESDRKPTWFGPEKAKLRLSEGRKQEFGIELACVVDRAVSRILRLHSAGPTQNVALSPALLATQKDTLQIVQFEAAQLPSLAQALSPAPYARPETRRFGRSMTRLALPAAMADDPAVARNDLPVKITQRPARSNPPSGAGRHIRRLNVQCINEGAPTHGKSASLPAQKR